MPIIAPQDFLPIIFWCLIAIVGNTTSKETSDSPTIKKELREFSVTLDQAVFKSLEFQNNDSTLVIFPNDERLKLFVVKDNSPENEQSSRSRLALKWTFVGGKVPKHRVNAVGKQEGRIGQCITIKSFQIVILSDLTSSPHLRVTLLVIPHTQVKPVSKINKAPLTEEEKPKVRLDRPKKTLKCPYLVDDFSLSSDGKRLAYRAETVVDVVRMDDFTKIASVGNFYLAMCLSPNGETIVTSDFLHNRLRFWDIASNRQIRRHRFSEYQPFLVEISPDGKTLATSMWRNVRLFHAATSAEKGLCVAERSVRSISFSPNGKLLAIAGKGLDVIVWDVNAEKEMTLLPTPLNITYSVSFSPDGRKLAASGGCGRIKIFDVKTRKEIMEISLPSSNHARALAFRPDGKILALGCVDGAIRCYDLQKKKIVQIIQAHYGRIEKLRYTPRGQFLLSSGWSDSNIRFWDGRIEPSKMGRSKDQMDQ